jgi:D-alanine transaminase
VSGGKEMTSMWAWWNGEFIDKDAPVIRLEDRGLTFGDGIFEVIRTIRGRLLFHEAHLRRMAQSAAFFGIPFPYEAAVLEQIARELIRRNSVSDGELYLQLTRGADPLRTHRFPPAGTPPTLFMLANPVRAIDPACWERGARVVTYPDLRHGLCEHKTLNLMPNVLAKNYAFDHDAYDALLYREDAIGRYVTEGGSSSYFCVAGGEVVTPALENILPGITRRKVIDLALAQGRRVAERRLHLNELLAADEIFLASTVSRVMPVGRVDERAFPAPGPVTRALAEAFDLLFRHELFD